MSLPRAMTPPTSIKSLLTRDEGVRLFPYVDTTGHLTIGAGRNLSVNGISSAEAELLLDNDIARCERELLTALPWVASLDWIRHAVLVSLVFNMGLAGLLGFRKMLAALEGQDYDGAALELLQSRYAEQVPQRAARLAKQLATGEWV